MWSLRGGGEEEGGLCVWLCMDMCRFFATIMFVYQVKDWVVYVFVCVIHMCIFFH
jgi:hypothetical protein